MKILLFGKFGQLGWELERTLQCLGQVLACDYPEVDFMHPASIRQKVLDFKPQIVLNAAAYTDVDRAEIEEERARIINSDAPAFLADTCRKNGVAFVHYSTDYVFDGQKGEPYFENDPTNPLNVYGITKLNGEKAVLEVEGINLIFRTSWLYSMRRPSFVSKILELSRTQHEMRIVEDQVGNPTWARALAEITAQLLAKAGRDPRRFLNERRGLFHLAGGGIATRFEWAKSILQNDPNKSQQIVHVVKPASSIEFIQGARRPTFSALNCHKFSRAFDLDLPEWRSTLCLALGES